MGAGKCQASNQANSRIAQQTKRPVRVVHMDQVVDILPALKDGDSPCGKAMSGLGQA